MRSKLLASLAGVAALALVAACQPAPAPVQEEPAPVAEATPAPTPALVDVVDTAVAAGTFTKLVAAVQAAGLAEALKAPGPITVFAPNDEAFAKIPAADLEALLKPENKDKLAGVLKHHVIQGAVASSTITGPMEVDTLNGDKLKIDVKDGKVLVGGATVVGADVQAANGVIHVVDTVIMPAAKK